MVVVRKANLKFKKKNLEAMKPWRANGPTNLISTQLCVCVCVCVLRVLLRESVSSPSPGDEIVQVTFLLLLLLDIHGQILRSCPSGDRCLFFYFLSTYVFSLCPPLLWGMIAHHHRTRCENLWTSKTSSSSGKKKLKWLSLLLRVELTPSPSDLRRLDYFIGYKSILHQGPIQI